MILKHIMDTYNYLMQKPLIFFVGSQFFLNKVPGDIKELQTAFTFFPNGQLCSLGSLIMLQRERRREILVPAHRAETVTSWSLAIATEELLSRVVYVI